MLFQSTGYLTLGAMGVELPRLGNQFRVAAPANTYRCRDGLDPRRRAARRALAPPRARCSAAPSSADDPRYATALARIARRDEVDALLARLARASAPVAEALAALLGARAFPRRPCAATPRPPPTRTCARATCSRRSSAAARAFRSPGPRRSSRARPLRVAPRRARARRRHATDPCAGSSASRDERARARCAAAGVVAGPLAVGRSRD